VTVYPMVDDGSGAASEGEITPEGPQVSDESYVVRANNIDSEVFTIAIGATVAEIITSIVDAINGSLNMPVIATDNTTDVVLTSKWEGTSANDIVVSVVGPTAGGTTFAFTQPTGGAVNPDITTALALIGDVWETLVLNCLDVADTTNLDLYQTEGESRWGALVRKPFIVFSGETATTAASAIAIPDARKTDKVNAQLVSPGSEDLPFVVAARGVARIAALADSNPPHDYGSQPLTGLVPGADSDQWSYADQDLAVKGGSSTAQVKDGVINLSDTVTFYHPDGDANPAYRYIVDIVKLQNVIYNLDAIFDTSEWAGAPLLPNDQPTTNRSAKKPKTAVAAVCAVLDGLGLDAIISDAKTAKANTFAEIDAANPKRLNVSTTVQLSGNTNIISVDLNFGFFFGAVTVTA
ncbi:MAG: phage tail protein, partial [Gammaproteobacteria bacterium]|nr:phage tail protein [Gammaproteobacteria bacterium]